MGHAIGIKVHGDAATVREPALPHIRVLQTKDLYMTVVSFQQKPVTVFAVSTCDDAANGTVTPCDAFNLSAGTMPMQRSTRASAAACSTQTKSNAPVAELR